MSYESFIGNGYLLIIALAMIGGALIVAALLINRQAAQSHLKEDRYRERLHEYARNTLSQLGVILIGISVSLFIFFFQQNYQERARRQVEVNKLLAEIAMQTSRAASTANSLFAFDMLVHDTDASYEVGSGEELAQQLDAILLVERDIDLAAVEDFVLSTKIGDSTLVGEINPELWFAIAEDESELADAARHLASNYADLRGLLGGSTPEVALQDPAREHSLAAEARDIFYDMDVVRDRVRHLLGRGCWFLSVGPDFLSLPPVDAYEADYATHAEWIDKGAAHLRDYEVGGRNCFDMLQYSPMGPPATENQKLSPRARAQLP